MTSIFIFFGHSKEDYGSIYEEEMLKRLLEWYPKYKGFEIINPADIYENIKQTREGAEDLKKGFWFIENKYYFPWIDKSDLVIVAKCWNDRSYRGRYTPGVLAEIEYAKKKGKKILEFGDEDEKLLCGLD